MEKKNRAHGGIHVDVVIIEDDEEKKDSKMTLDEYMKVFKKNAKLLMQAKPKRGRLKDISILRSCKCIINYQK